MSEAPKDAKPDLEALLGIDGEAGAGPEIPLGRLDAEVLVESAGDGDGELGRGDEADRDKGRGDAGGAGAAKPGEWVGITRPSPRSSAPRFLTDVIVEMGFGARGEVDDAIETARSAGTTPEKVLLEKGVLTGDSLSRALAERYALEHLDLGTFHVDMTAANLVNTTSAKRYHAVPVAFI